MNSRETKMTRSGRAGAMALAIGSAALLLGGCTVYASGTDDWETDHHSSSARDESRPPPRSVVPVSLIGREMNVYLRDAATGEPGHALTPMRGRLRDMGDWVRLERDDGSTVLIPREQIRYVEPIVSAATTQP